MIGSTLSPEHSAPDGSRPSWGSAEQLGELRHSIDNIDAALIHLLAERFKFTQKVGRLKADLGLPPADPDRETQQVTRLRSLAAEAGIDTRFAESFLAFLITEVIRRHERQRRDGG